MRTRIATGLSCAGPCPRYDFIRYPEKFFNMQSFRTCQKFQPVILPVSDFPSRIREQQSAGRFPTLMPNALSVFTGFVKNLSVLSNGFCRCVLI
ncbi:MAG: hypothetical protein DRH32_04020 [Deltaproteobacteria bacterium]|nr:MAG: hypothetical protein DRH32_04020 [Deltaproteobacteria bacterium]